MDCIAQTNFTMRVLKLTAHSPTITDKHPPLTPIFSEGFRINPYFYTSIFPASELWKTLNPNVFASDCTKRNVFNVYLYIFVRPSDLFHFGITPETDICMYKPLICLI